MQIGRWLRSVADLPRADCEALLSTLTGWSRAQILASPERLIAADDLPRLSAGVAALRDGQPLAYVLGCAGFWTLELEVTPAVLIPRPETELLVELTLALAPPAARILDLGTGSGAIGLAVATSRADLQVTASDRFPAALEVARRNAQRCQANIDFQLSHWFEGFLDRAGSDARWHLVVSNPPYIAANDPHLPALRHEPRAALVSGSDGLDDLSAIIRAAPARLYPGGYLLLEHGYNQAAAVRALLSEAGFAEIHSHRDLAGIERVTVGCWLPPTPTGAEHRHE